MHRSGRSRAKRTPDVKPKLGELGTQIFFWVKRGQQGAKEWSIFEMDCSRRFMATRLLALKKRKDNFKVSRKLWRGSKLWMNVRLKDEVEDTAAETSTLFTSSDSLLSTFVWWLNWGLQLISTDVMLHLKWVRVRENSHDLFDSRCYKQTDNRNERKSHIVAISFCFLTDKIMKKKKLKNDFCHVEKHPVMFQKCVNRGQRPADVDRRPQKTQKYCFYNRVDHIWTWFRYRYKHHLNMTLSI